LPTEARLGDTLGPFGLRLLERVETTTNRFSVDAELLGDVYLVLARANAPAAGSIGWDPILATQDVTLGYL
jgi:hypothetical protein